jgi:hypothetical protein
MIESWFCTNNNNWPQVKQAEDLIVELAKFEWGKVAEVFFKSKDLVIVKSGNLERVFKRKGGS